MKIKSKLLIATILSIFALFMINSVKAVGLVYQAVADYGVNDTRLLYRIVVKPDQSSLNEFSSYNTWNTEEHYIGSNPTYNTYKTRYLIFTKGYIGSYTPNTGVNIGYSTYTGKVTDASAFNSSDISAVTAWINSATGNWIKGVSVTDGFGSWFYQYNDNGTKAELTDENLSEAAFDAYNKNAISEVGREVTLSPLLSTKSEPSDSGDEYVIPSTNTYSIKGVVDWYVRRQMLYSEKYSGRPDSKNHKAKFTYYIMDVELNNEITSQLTEYYRKTGGKIYVSAIGSTLNKWSNGTEFYTLTPGALLHSKLRDFDGNLWSDSTLGVDNDNEGKSSVLNLWDNELILPDGTDKAIKVLVNHIAVNVDSSNNKSFTVIDTEEETLSIGNSSTSVTDIGKAYLADDATITTTNTGKEVLISKEKLEEAGMLYRVRTPKAGTVCKVNKLKDISTDYTYVGYFVDTVTTIDTVTPTYFENKYSVKKTGEPTVTIDTDSNEIIVNMYYETEAKTVTVIHNVCTDSGLTNCTVIDGNKQITIKNGTKSETITYDGVNSVETYFVNKKYDVTAAKVSNGDYTYKGYKAKYGTTETGLINSSSCTVTAASSGDNNMTINFYYTGTVSTTTSEKEKPTIDIPGTLTVQTKVGVSTTCEEYYSVPTNAENNANDIYVGIKNTPTYVLAGIDVEQKEKEGNVTINVTIKFGSTNSKTWNIQVPYEFSYYAIQNLLIYKYQTADIYDAGSANTKGESLFSKNKLTITPNGSSTLTLYSSINQNISSANRENWTNYLRISYALNSMINGAYNPTDSIENSYRRYGTAISPKYTPYYIAGLTYNHIYTDKAISSYIKYSIDGSFYNSLQKAYEDITTKGSTNIVIELLSADIYNKINYNGDGTLSESDIVALKNNTDNLVKNAVSLGNTLDTAYSNYNSAQSSYYGRCQDYGYGYGDCYSTVVNNRNYYSNLSNTYSNNAQNALNLASLYKSNCQNCSSGYTSYYTGYTGYYYYRCPDSLEQWDSNVNLYNTTNCYLYNSFLQQYISYYNDYKTYNSQYLTYNNQLNNISSLYISYINKQNAYNTALSNYTNAVTNATNAYEREREAVQHIDEAMYIQDNLWNVYKDYTKEDIAKLLGLDIKFEYSSGNAKLGNIDLMNITKGTLELKSGFQALSGQLVGDEIGTQSLVALRPTMTTTQKEYYTKGITGVNWIPNERAAVTSTYYKDSDYIIPIAKLNGTRILAGTAYYKTDTSNKIGTSATVKDNMYYEQTVDADTQKVTNENVFKVSNTASFSKKYGVSQNNSDEFNVYTPLVVTATVNKDIDIVDQTTTSKYENKVDVIQSNSTFTVNFTNNKDKVYSSGRSDFTSRYKQVTYIKFEFAVSSVKYVGSNGYVTSYGTAKANEWIGPIYGNYITAVPYMNTAEGDSVTDQTFNYYVIAAAVNTKDSWTKQLLAYIKTSLDDLTNTDLINTFKNSCGYEGGNKLSYYADYKGEMIIVNRMYDFRVTDLKDVDWKDVFRKNTSSSYVNQHSGIAYYAGLTKWNTQNPVKYNQIIGRTTDEIGSSPTRILPLGPYKNTNTSYISAPKMGYRFSFDLKVTGAMNNNKYVEIKPSFYYISKDGKVFYTEYTSGNEGIYLFYKNSSGQYVRVGSSSDTYKIQFTPNDGYRALVETDVKNLNSNVVTLGGLRNLVLKYTETTTVSKNDAAITYYGEYKLPNSTIAVKVNKNGKYDINNPLTDGYIGVVFDIVAHESDDVYLQYGKNSYKGEENTSQWDYEGYLGLSEPGKSYSTTLKLEKGTWNIDNATYNKIKGTVILYDTDNRASSDFD